jgi:bacteriocin biosynthesis cyclodehydratase domain-containing protein
LQLRTPSLKPRIAWHRIGSEQVILCDGDREWLLSTRLYADLLEAIDGSTTDEIVERLSAAFEPEEILFALHNLKVGGYVEEAAIPLETTREGSSAHAEPERDDFDARSLIGSTSISCVGVRIDPALLVDQLRVQGISITEGDQPLIVFTDDYLNPALAEMDRLNWQRRRNWVLARLHGSTVWIGPHFKPGASVCWQCLAQRMREAQWVKQAIRARATRSSRPALTSGSSFKPRTILNLLTSEVAPMLTGHSIPANTLISFESDTRRIAHHYVRGVLGCQQCGPDLSLEDAERQSAMLEALRSDAEDARCFAHLISPLVGLVPEVRDFEGSGERPTRIVTALQPIPESVAASSRRLAPRDLAFGKGYHRTQAVIGCIGEAIERYSIMQVSVAPVIASARELGDQAIDPCTLLNFSAQQYSHRAKLNTLHGGFNWIPVEFDPTKPIGWTHAVSMSHAKSRLAPAAHCYFGNKQDVGRQFMRADTNGCAGGSSIRDAQSRALLELIERDAAAIWWYNRVSRPLVDLESFANPMFKDFSSWANRVGRTLRVLDITTDLAIPAYVAISARYPLGECVAFGFGCHPDACRGIGHALAEMYQMCALFEAAFEDERFIGFEDAKRRALAHWLREATLDMQHFMEPVGSRNASDYDPVPLAGSQDVLDQVLRSLQAHGLESYCLELTRRDIGLPVVRVLVPGLRHFWARLAPGRLYDVPTSLGWLAKPREEHDLNPTPIFI